MGERNKNLNMILAALFLALGYLLPYLTGQLPEIGKMLCPMHIPVLLCGYLCGWPWGLAVGVLAPLLRAVTVGTPILFPSAVCMAAELAVYGILAGVLHRVFPAKKGYLYASLPLAMIGGRLVWGMMMALCLGIAGKTFGWSAFLAGAVTGALPGIFLQLLLVPPLVMLLEKRHE